MTDQLQSLQEDISFLKALAVEGRSPVLLGGSSLVAAGAIYGAASLGHWSIAAGLVPVSTPWVFPILWAGATAAFLAVLSVLKRQMRDAKATSAPNKASAMAWQGVGWAIFTLSLCMAIVAWRARSDTPLQLFPSIILALYGLAWSVAAAASRIRWTSLAAVGSFVAAVLVALVSDKPVVFLLFAGALVALAIVPGLALVRRARAAS
jgi:hypothetical protein